MTDDIYYVAEYHSTSATGDSPIYRAVRYPSSDTTANSPEYISWDRVNKVEATDEELIEEEIKKSFSKKDQKMVEKEIRDFMTKKLRDAIRMELDDVMEDIEILREEKTKLELEISNLRSQITEEKKEIETMLKKYANIILRYQLMDL